MGTSTLGTIKRFFPKMYIFGAPVESAGPVMVSFQFDNSPSTGLINSISGILFVFSFFLNIYFLLNLTFYFENMYQYHIKGVIPHI